LLVGVCGGVSFIFRWVFVLLEGCWFGLCF